MRHAALLVLGTIMLILAVCGAAHAADSFSARDAQGNRMRAFGEPCALASGWLAKGLKRAEITYRGKVYAACWTVAGDWVFFFDEAGDVSRAPAAAFQKDVEA